MTSSSVTLAVAPAPEDAFEPSALTPAAELGTHLRIWARSGLFDRDALAGVASEFTEVPAALRERILDGTVGEAWQRMSGVKHPTEAERLVAVLRAIPGVGVSLFGAETQHDGFDRAAERARATGREPEGLCVMTAHGFHVATTGGGVLLHFSAGPGEDPVHIGRRIEAALRAEGLPVAWSGEAHDVITVPIRWLVPLGFLADEL
jgi:hypothetical protein